MRSPLSSCLASLALLVGTASAHAASSAVALAQVGQLSIELIDLDLTDGVAPSLTYQDTKWYAETYYTGPGSPPSVFRYTEGKVEFVNSAGTTQASTAASGTYSYAMIDVPPAPGEFGHGFTSEAAYSASFVLSPNTGLRLTASAGLDVLEIEDGLAFASALLDSSLVDSTGGSSFDFLLGDESGGKTGTLTAYLVSGGTATRGQYSLRTMTQASIVPGRRVA